MQQLGYGSYSQVKELAGIAVREDDNQIQDVKPWAMWRDLFEYMCCVEYSRESLLNLPTGRYLGSVNAVPARYHSASLIFFCQATLDNLSVWLNSYYSFGLKGNNIAFHKNNIRPRLKEKNQEYDSAIGSNKNFISQLEKYRRIWIHQLTGGAEIYSDKSPSEHDAQITVMVPIDPEIPAHRRGDGKKYIKRINKVRTNNNGEWLYPIDKFANRFADGTKHFLLVMLEIVLKTKDGLSG